MNRGFRLRKNTDFQRVRREGKSFAHPLVVLLVAKSPHAEKIRIGVAASKAVGKAVARNRAKRRLREIMRPLLPYLPRGYDLVLIARKPMSEASFAEIKSAVHTLLRRAGLLPQNFDDAHPSRRTQD